MQCAPAIPVDPPAARVYGKGHLPIRRHPDRRNVVVGSHTLSTSYPDGILISSTGLLTGNPQMIAAQPVAASLLLDK
jgi:hypothetical protein